MSRRKNRIVYEAGAYGRKVSIFRTSRSPNLYYRFPDPGGKGYVIKSLGHDDVKRAEDQAEEMAKRLRAAEMPAVGEKVTMGTIFEAFRKGASGNRVGDRDG